MMDADKRDSAVAYIEADPDRSNIVRVMEKKGEPLTLNFLNDRFPLLSEGQLYQILSDLGEKDVVQKMSENPPTWDFTLFGREILYALDPPLRIYKFSPFHVLRTLFSSFRKSQTSQSQ